MVIKGVKYTKSQFLGSRIMTINQTINATGNKAIFTTT